MCDFFLNEQSGLPVLEIELLVLKENLVSLLRDTTTSKGDSAGIKTQSKRFSTMFVIPFLIWLWKAKQPYMRITVPQCSALSTIGCIFVLFRLAIVLFVFLHQSSIINLTLTVLKQIWTYQWVIRSRKSKDIQHKTTKRTKLQNTWYTKLYTENSNWATHTPQ